MKKLLVVLLAIFMLAGCGSTNETPKAPVAGTVEGNNFAMIDGFDITTLDYVYNNKSSNGDYTSNFIEGLLTQDSHGKLVPGMATAWEANDDATVWTFTIRDDAWWITAEGEQYAKVTAEDFVTGLRHGADFNSETIGLIAPYLVGLQDYMDGTGTWEDVGIKAEGNKLTYTFSQGLGYFDGMTTYSILWPINKEFLESSGEGCKLGAGDQANCGFGAVEPSSILYNGCYLLTNLTAASVVEFDYNPYYWDIANVHVPHVTVTYTNGEDPAQNFTMFVNGEVTSTGINKALPDVLAKANELYADNMFLSDTTATSYWGAFNFNRRLWNLYSDPSVSTTSKNDQQKQDTYNAILNANFRKAVFNAFSTKAYEMVTNSEEDALNAARNTLVPYTFAVTSDGRSYGSILTAELEKLEPLYAGINLNDGQDGWYNVERAQAFLAKAKEELGDTVSWPIHIDIPVYAANENMKNRGLAQKQSIEDALGAENVVIDFYMAPGDSGTYYDAFYTAPTGSDNSIDMAFAAGWGPDYGDPLTYLHCYDSKEGDMLAYSGLNLTSENEDDTDRAVKETIGLYAVQEVIDAASAATGDERIELFAKAEAMLEANGIFRSYTTSGGNTIVNKIKPYSAAYGLYGQAAYNAVPYFKYMEVLDAPVTKAEHDAAKAAWLKGE